MSLGPPCCSPNSGGVGQLWLQPHWMPPSQRKHPAAPGQKANLGICVSYGFLWIPMDSYGFLWIPMDSYGFLWIPMDSYGFLWIPMDSYGFLWIPMDSYGFLWIPMDSYGFLWIPMDSYGFLWIPMVSGWPYGPWRFTQRTHRCFHHNMPCLRCRFLTSDTGVDATKGMVQCDEKKTYKEGLD